jgi:hypothetical protein
VFSHTYELYSLATIPNWRQRCRKAACFITEVWSGLLPEYLLELLSAFDHIFLGARSREAARSDRFTSWTLVISQYPCELRNCWKSRTEIAAREEIGVETSHFMLRFP